ncbi:MAG: hypothetical protein AAF320_00410 [Myxococcota bacterium]
MSWKKKLLTKTMGCCALASALALPTWGYEKLQPFAGTIELGGAIHFPMEVNHQGDFAMAFHMTPSLGFFVNDGWEIVLRGILHRQIAGEASARTGGLWFKDLLDEGGFGLGFEYLFDGGYILPYLGVLMDFFWPNDAAMQVHLETPVGMLIPFNDYVAADLGIAIRLIFPTDTGFDRFIISPGFLGVRAFF